MVQSICLSVFLILIIAHFPLAGPKIDAAMFLNSTDSAWVAKLLFWAFKEMCWYEEMKPNWIKFTGKTGIFWVTLLILTSSKLRCMLASWKKVWFVVFMQSYTTFGLGLTEIKVQLWDQPLKNLHKCNSAQLYSCTKVVMYNCESTEEFDMAVFVITSLHLQFFSKVHIT